MNETFEGYTFTWNQGEFVVILCFPDLGDTVAQVQKAANMGDRLALVLDQYFNVSVSIGISDPCRGYAQLAPAYFEACRAAQQSYYTGDQSVLLFSDLPSNYGSPDRIDVSDLSDELAEAIELHDVQMIGRVFEALISLLNEPNVSRKQAYDSVSDRALDHRHLRLDENSFREITGDRSLMRPYGLGTLAQIINWLIGLERRLCRLVAREDEREIVVCREGRVYSSTTWSAFPLSKSPLRSASVLDT